jgi:hypothetical protein
VISWLNKQINDNNIASSGNKPIFNYESPTNFSSGGVLFKPVGAALLNSSGSSSPSTFATTTGMHSGDSALSVSGAAIMRISSASSGTIGTVNGTGLGAPFLSKSNELINNNTNRLGLYGTNYTQQRLSGQTIASNGSLGFASQGGDNLKENQDM